MVLKVYYDLRSQPCRAVVLFLKLTNIPYEAVEVELFKGNQRNPEYTKVITKVNPLHKVPVIDHDGFILTESIAIVRYLCREFKVDDHWYPKNSKHQARVDEYLEWQHLNTRLFGVKLFCTKIIYPILENKPVDEEQAKFFQDNFEKTLNNILKGYLKDKQYLCGDQISVTDIFAVCEIDQPLMLEYDPISSRPEIKAWLKRARKAMGTHYKEVHRICDEVKQAIKEGSSKSST